MLRYLLPLLVLTITFSSEAQQKPSTQYYNEDHFIIEGSAIPATEKENRYDRLPANYKDKVRKEVWDLSKSSAGMSIRFNSNSTSIRIKWEVLNNFKMSHMAETGIKGVDLYCKMDNQWQYVNTAKPTGKINEAMVINNLTPLMREYKLFLPLYDGVVSLAIGIDSLSQIIKPEAATTKPIVFYGTSITQGGCASRPGMAYTNIISRKLNRDCINLGFSGNGRMETPIAELLSTTDAAFFVIDCIPNMTLEQVNTNTIPLVEIIRAKQANTPIILVENTLFEKTSLDEGLKKEILTKNAALKAAFDKLKKQGTKNIFYIETKDALGDDHEATVDGVHFTDLGFMRFAEFLVKKFHQFKVI